MYGKNLDLPCDVVTKQETASSVAKTLYRSKFGDNQDIKRVYLSLIDDRVWKARVVGKDSLVVYLQRRDGRILRMDIYGKAEVDAEFPFDVVEYQKSWLLEGNLPKGHLGGTGAITLAQRDGKVVAFSHEK